MILEMKIKIQFFKNSSGPLLCSFKTIITVLNIKNVFRASFSDFSTNKILLN